MCDTEARNGLVCQSIATLPTARSPGRVPLGWPLRVLFAALIVIATVGCDRAETVQTGPRGLSLGQLYDMDRVAAQIPENQIPEPEFRDPPMDGLPPLTDVHQNIQVLGDLNVLEFARLMNAVSTWVSPEVGCEYCHNTDDMASDEKYGKNVARHMFEMVRDINTNWKSHVKETGVTCWTCHRGENVPTGIWFKEPGPKVPGSYLAHKGWQNVAGVANNGYSSLPFDPLTPFLEQDYEIGIQGLRPLAGENNKSIKQAEWTYSLMMYMSNSLGVNCTYCHNTRAMGRWEESMPQRVQAWYGIRMVRDINEKYLTPLKDLLPAHRLSPEGDAPKVGCETCHKGAYKPLYGISMLDDYGELRGVITERPTPWEIPFLEEQEQDEATEGEGTAVAPTGETPVQAAAGAAGGPPAS